MPGSPFILTKSVWLSPATMDSSRVSSSKPCFLSVTVARPFGTSRTVTGVLPRGCPLTVTVAPAGSLVTSMTPESIMSSSSLTSGVRPLNLTSTVRGW